MAAVLVRLYQRTHFKSNKVIPNWSADMPIELGLKTPFWVCFTYAMQKKEGKSEVFIRTCKKLSACLRFVILLGRIIKVGKVSLTLMMVLLG